MKNVKSLQTDRQWIDTDDGLVSIVAEVKGSVFPSSVKSTNFPLNLCHTADLLQDEHHLDTCMYVYSIFCACIYVNFLTFFYFSCRDMYRTEYFSVLGNRV